MNARRVIPLLFAAALVLSACAASDAKKAAQAAGTQLEAHFFQAGAADAILLTTAHSAVLVDAGEQGFGKEILSYLEEKGIDRLDALIVTHFDKDHVGGAAKVLGGIAVDTVLQSNCPKDSEAYEKYQKALGAAGIAPLTVRETYTFTLDGVVYSVDPPRQSSYVTDESNNSSLIVTVTDGETRFLLAGDAQTARLAEYLSTAPAHCDVLKVAHHGRSEPLLGKLLAAVTPDYAVVTSSDDEPEDADTIAALEAAGAQVLLTREGAVTLRSDGKSVTIVPAA